MISEHVLLSNRYQTEELLGEGGMARVYRGIDRVLNRPVAIKVLSSRLATDQGFVARFRREAQAAARLNHPNVVAVYDSGADGDLHFIVMEYVSGPTLSDVLRREHAMPIGRVIEIGTAVCRALSFAHKEGLVHRDVKPGNIMVTEQDEVKLTDFGIARATTADTLTQTARVLGTAAYLSPEQARGDRVDVRSDLYSLGCVLYEMVAARPPFIDDSPIAIAYKHQTEEPVAPSRHNPACPPALDAVILRALAKEPDQRYGSAEQMERDLVRAGEGQPPVAGPVGEPTVVLRPDPTAVLSSPAAVAESPPPTAVPLRPRRWPLVVLTMVALGLLALMLYLTLASDPTGETGSPPGAGAGQGSPSGQGSPTGQGPQTPSPEPTTPPAELSVEDAVAALQDVLNEGVASEEITEPAALQIAEEVQGAVDQYQRGNLGRALDQLANVHVLVDEQLSSGDITTEERATMIHSAVDALAAALESTPPPDEDRGGGGNGGGGNGGGGNGGNGNGGDGNGGGGNEGD
jgi:eukaryotic-like serine/threonine-protein kinase